MLEIFVKNWVSTLNTWIYGRIGISTDILIFHLVYPLFVKEFKPKVEICWNALTYYMTIQMTKLGTLPIILYFITFSLIKLYSNCLVDPTRTMYIVSEPCKCFVSTIKFEFSYDLIIYLRVVVNFRDKQWNWLKIQRTICATTPLVYSS